MSDSKQDRLEAIIEADSDLSPDDLTVVDENENGIIITDD